LEQKLRAVAVLNCDFAPAHLRDHLASRRRQDHADRKLLLFGGAIQLAGQVKAKGERRAPAPTG
jgi:hypothetical protein